MSTATLDAVDSLQATLEPLETLQGEHTQLETWVHDSFSALEKLHSELTEWQSELARKQTEVDLREDEVRRGEERVVTGDDSELSEHWRALLEEAQQDTQILEEENAEQLQEMENMEITLVQMEKQLQTAEKRLSDLTQLLETERVRSDQEQHQWQGEFKDMRRLLEKQCTMLEDRIRDSRETADELQDEAIEGESEGIAPAISRTAELRRRAKARRVARLKKHQDGEESSNA